MKYLQGMTRQGEEPDNRPPRSVLDSAEYRSNMSAVRSPPSSPGSLGNGNGHMSLHNGGIDGEDADSNFQEGRTSEIGDLEPAVRLRLLLEASDSQTPDRENLARMTLQVPNTSPMTPVPLLETSAHFPQTMVRNMVILMPSTPGT
jgi:hypothetical protein